MWNQISLIYITEILKALLISLLRSVDLTHDMLFHFLHTLMALQLSLPHFSVDNIKISS